MLKLLRIFKFPTLLEERIELALLKVILANSLFNDLQHLLLHFWLRKLVKPRVLALQLLLVGFAHFFFDFVLCRTPILLC